MRYIVMAIVCSFLITGLAAPADAGIIQDLAAIKVQIANVQGRVDQFEIDYGPQLTPAQQAKVDELQAKLQEAQNKAEELMALL